MHIYIYIHNIHLFFNLFFSLKNFCPTSFMSVPTVLPYSFQSSILFPSWTMIRLTGPALMNVPVASACITNNTTKNNLSHKFLPMCANISTQQIPSNGNAQSKVMYF